MFLDCDIGRNIVYTSAVDGNPEECTAFFLRTFLSELPQLQCIRLIFARDHDPEGEKLLQWLSMLVLATSRIIYQHSELPRSPPPINFLQLQQLDIGMMSVTISSLIAVFQKFAAALRGVSFHKVCLLGLVPAGEAKVSFGQNFSINCQSLTISISQLSPCRISITTEETTNMNMGFQLSLSKVPSIRCSKNGVGQTCRAG